MRLCRLTLGDKNERAILSATTLKKAAQSEPQSGGRRYISVASRPPDGPSGPTKGHPRRLRWPDAGDGNDVANEGGVDRAIDIGDGEILEILEIIWVEREGEER